MNVWICDEGKVVHIEVDGYLSVTALVDSLIDIYKDDKCSSDPRLFFDDECRKRFYCILIKSVRLARLRENAEIKRFEHFSVLNRSQQIAAQISKRLMNDI